MTLRFGTDGVRGNAAEDLTDRLVEALGRAAAEVLAAGSDEHESRRGAQSEPTEPAHVAPDAIRRGFLIGRDTRESGTRLETALATGLIAGGVRPVSVGVVPTPAVAFLCEKAGVPGAMISASHNPWHDNGIKFFTSRGRKLTDEQEAGLESELDGLLRRGSAARGLGTLEAGSEGLGIQSGEATPVGEATADHQTRLPAVESWSDSLVDSLDGRRFDGIKVVVDCANGSLSDFAPDVLRSLGATVIVLHADPDGRNINERCGSTHPEDLMVEVVSSGADVGFAFDGDADRVLAVDASGNLVDGDQLIAVCAVDRFERGLLPGGSVVVTVMTNLGFHQGMARRGIEVVTTPVGDRSVLDAMEQGGHVLGGEQSGHIIFGDRATTGDGLLSALQVLDVLVRSGLSLEELAASAMRRLPQVLLNVKVPADKGDPVSALEEHVRRAEALLGDQGRVLVRRSGTEPLLRIMVEAQTAEEAETIANDLAGALG